MADPSSLQPSFHRPDSRHPANCAALAGLFIASAFFMTLHRSDAALPTDNGLFLGLGLLGLWRYGWTLTHWLRGLWYLGIDFPRFRRRADRLEKQEAPPLYIIVPSYRMPPNVFTGCFRRLLHEAQHYPGEVAIAANVTTAEEQAQLEHWYHQMGISRHVRLWLQRQDGSGKRAALAESLRAVARDAPAPNALVLLMDGDTLVPPNALLKTARILQAWPQVAAVTTDNRAAAIGSHWMREWYALKLAQRHILMASMSMSRRLLVLTGRFSMLRAAHAVQPSFVERIEFDQLPHWRFGATPMLTGDDKSTWYWLLERGKAMLYVPDVVAWSLETPCAPTFFRHSTTLMRRWYGNMLRNNSRAVALGPKRMPFFVWWSLIDQRLSIWTTLTAPAAIALLAVFAGGGVSLFAAYGLWVIGTRSLYGLLLGSLQGRASFFYPYLLWYNQLAGSLVKVHSQFNLAHQRWARQSGLRLFPRPLQQWISHGFEITAVLTFVYWVALMVGVASAPRF